QGRAGAGGGPPRPYLQPRPWRAARHASGQPQATGGPCAHQHRCLRRSTGDDMKPGVLLMTYGSPRTLDEVEGYYTDIRGGRRPSPEAVEELSSRYECIGGSPLPEITVRQARALESRLAGDAGGSVKVFVGMKHWHPFIAEAVDEIVTAGVDTLVGIALAPHYSRMSIGGHAERVQAAQAARE